MSLRETIRLQPGQWAMFVVVAAVDGKEQPWRSVCCTDDADYAEATLGQFKEAEVPVRLDLIVIKPKRKR